MTTQIKHIISKKGSRKDCESICGLIEWASMAIPFMRALIIEFRKTWIKLPFDNSKCNPRDSTQYLQILLQLLSAPLYTPYQHLFITTTPTQHYTTDASGNDCIGGYAGLPSKFGKTGAAWFFTQPLIKCHILTNETNKTNEFNTTFLELLGLYYVLRTALTIPHDSNIIWWTDSMSGTICWEKQSSTHIPTNRILIAIATHCARNHILVQAKHIKRDDNVTADMLTHANTSLFCKTQGSRMENLRSVPNSAVNKARSIRYPLLAQPSPSPASTQTMLMD
jgi:hypothetical protein